MKPKKMKINLIIGPFHLAWPNLFSFNGSDYLGLCVLKPETCQAHLISNPITFLNWPSFKRGQTCYITLKAQLYFK